MATEIDAQFASKTNDFALELYKQVASTDKKNVIISPLSISTCLSLAACGAAGQTAEEMFSVLKYDGAAQKQSVTEQYGRVLAGLNANPTLNIANKVYVMNSYTVKASFGEVAQKSFYSEAESVNFADNEGAAKTINGWVEQKTNDKIKDLISSDSLSQDTRMVLVNAIHFKGTWKHQFDKQQTMPMPFWISATESIDVPTMNIKKHFNYGVFEDLNASALELTYSDGDLSMLIILPNERDGLSKLEEKLQSVNIADLTSKMYSQEVEVALPKFKIEFDLDLKETLEKLGMGTMFTDKADFSDLLEQPDPLYVSKVVHKAFIEVNEEGTEAAAATGMIMMARCFIPPCRFAVEHPFYFALVDRKLNLVAFNGRIQDPK